jgi:hypothetical protein
MTPEELADLAYLRRARVGLPARDFARCYLGGNNGSGIS